MSDYIPCANQDDCMELFDWNAYEQGGLVDFVGDWARSPIGSNLMSMGALNVTAQAWLQDPVRTDSGLFRPTCSVDSSERSEGNSAEGCLVPVDYPACFAAFDEPTFKPNETKVVQDEMSRGGSETTASTIASAEFQNRSGSKNPEPFLCPYHACNYRARRDNVRGGQWDLRRHINSRHLKHKDCVCPARGCFKKHLRTAFARPDKLTAHFRALHSSDTIVECPQSTCKSFFMTADLLPVHMRLAHDSDSRVEQLLVDLSWKRKCPVRPCQLRVDLFSLNRHITSHSPIELQANIEALHRENFMPFFRSDDGLIALTSLQQTFEIPETFLIVMTRSACHIWCNTLEEYHDHLVKTHLTGQNSWEYADHTEAVKKLALSSLGSRYDTNASRNRVLAKSCGEVGIDLRELIGVRRQILRDFPAFGTALFKSAWLDLVLPNGRPSISP